MSEADRRASRPGPGSLQSQADAHGAETLATETRMRRALGLSPGVNSVTPQQRPEQARARHRFVQDGGVPVVVLNHKSDADSALRDRCSGLESQLEVERAAHASSRRALSEQQAAFQALQTRLAHAELAHSEALEGERRARIVAQQALAELQASLPVRGRLAEARFHAAEAIPGEVAAELPKRRPGRPKLDSAAAEKPKRGRPRIHPVPEPKPVRWWTPSFKAKSKS